MRLISRPVHTLWCACSFMAGSLALCAESNGPSLAELTAKADTGDAQAMVTIAQRYDSGSDGVSPDGAKARQWYEKAAAKGNGQAQLELAKMYAEGRGVEASATEAFKWTKLAAEGGVVSAQLELAGYYERAEGTAKNLVEALKWYLAAAEKNEAKGQYAAALAYSEGSGTKKDVIAAAKWLQRAVNGEHSAAIDKLQELKDSDPELEEKVLAAASREVKALIARAEGGDAKAQWELGDKFSEGKDGLLQNQTRAAAWTRKAAEQGLAQAQNDLGWHLLTGNGVVQNVGEARTWFEKAAAQDWPSALVLLAGMYREGNGVKPDAAEAFRLMRRAAELGHDEAQKEMGDAYRVGLEGVSKNPTEAMRWYTAAAEQKHTGAMHALALMAMGEDGRSPNPALARNWLNRASELGDEDARQTLATMDQAELDAKLATQLPAGLSGATRDLFLAALKGAPDSQFNLGVAYGGAGKADGLPRDLVQQAKWYRLAAEQKHAAAQRSLAELYTKGEGVTRDDAEAFKGMKQAAENRDQAAIFLLAGMYREGRGVAKNDAEAVTWLSKAADRKNAEAMFRLSEIYGKGVNGGAPDPAKAREWLVKAAGAGQAGAKRQLAEEVERERLANNAAAERDRVAQQAVAEQERAAKNAVVEKDRAAKFAVLEQDLDTAFAVAFNVDERAKAAEVFAKASETLGRAQNMTKPQISEKVLTTLLPRMEANLGEAGAYMMAVYDQAFDQPTMTRVLPQRVRDSIRAHASNITAAFQQKQDALGPIQALIPPALAGDVPKQLQIGDYLMQNHAAHDEETAVRWYKRAADAGNAVARQKINAIVGPWFDRAFAAYNEKKYAVALAGFKRAAEAGMVEAQFNLALMYVNGTGMPAKDLAEAARWNRLAAEQGYPDAMVALGFAYRDGTGVPIDEALALTWFKRAAEKGHVLAQAWVSVLDAGKTPAERGALAFEKGRAANGGKDELELNAQVDFLRYAAKLGNAEAREFIAQLGRVPPPNPAQKQSSEGFVAYQAKNFETALKLWTEAAAQNHPDALYNLGMLYENGQGVPVDRAKALAWYEKALAAKSNIADEAVKRVKPMVFLEEGITAYQAQKFPEALAAWEKAAALGNASAMFNLGVLSEAGEGVPLDLKKALAQYEQAQAAGYAKAKDAIALLKGKIVGADELAKGQESEKNGDYEEAMAWYKKSADLGNVYALVEIGGLYNEGRGVEKDLEKAIEWYKKAEAKGDTFAGIMAKAAEDTLPIFNLMKSQQQMSKLRDQIDGVVRVDAPPAPLGTKTGVKNLRKNSPWTYDDILAALKEGADHAALASAISRDKTKDFYAIHVARLENTPEGRRIEDYSTLSSTLYDHSIPGAGAWTYEMAEAAVEQRRAQLGRLPKVIDTPELRAKAAAGDTAALFQLVMVIPETELKLGKRPEVPPEELRRKILETRYAPGYAYVAEGFRHNVDKSKDDPVRRAELLLQAAQAGDPKGMRELGMLFVDASDAGVAMNIAEAEYWLIAAAARAAEGTLESPYENPGRDVAFFYSFAKPNGGPVMWPLTVEDEPTLRWARELLRRGGKLAEVANVALDKAERDPRAKNIRAKLAALAPEGPAITEAEVTKLETAAKAGDAAAALKLGDAFATGRGVRQNDFRAVGCYELAAAKGSVKAMRALAYHSEKGFGVKQSGAQRVSWLEKAGAAGDKDAWREVGNLHQFYNADKTIGEQYPRAMAAYGKAIAAGDGKAYHQLALMYLLGRGVPVDLAKGEELLRKGAIAGDVSAQSRLGSVLSDAKKFTEAATWFGKAADASDSGARFAQARALKEAGDPKGALVAYRLVVAEQPDHFQAQMELGLLHEDAKDFSAAATSYRAVLAVKSEVNTYRDWAKIRLEIAEEELNPKPGGEVALRKLAEAGDANAMIEYARKIAKDRKPEALEWLRKAAEKGNATAMLMLSGETMATDKPGALEWMKKAVAAGNLEAKFRLGVAMFQGKEVPLDQAGGLKFVTEAADGGLAAAQFEVGRTLVVGSPGVVPQPQKGLELLRKAAAQNLPAAMAVLGEIYEKGVPANGAIAGVTANPREALSWYERALKAGVQQVKPAVDRLRIVVSGKTPPPIKK